MNVGTDPQWSGGLRHLAELMAMADTGHRRRADQVRAAKRIRGSLTVRWSTAFKSTGRQISSVLVIGRDKLDNLAMFHPACKP